MSTEINYILEQGSTFNVLTQGVRRDGSFFDLSDYTYRGQMRGDFSGSVVENFDVATTGSATDGRLLIQLAASQSAAIPAGRYVYDCEIVSGSIVRRWQEGKILVTPEVTK